MLGTVAGDAAPAQQPVNFGGPVIPGVCVLNQQDIFNTAKVGVAANAQFRKMRDVTQNDVNAQEAGIKADQAALGKTKLAPAQMEVRRQALARRQDALQLKAAKESQELEAVRRDAVVRIAAAAQPLIKQVYGQKKCGMLLSSSGVLAANTAMDITPAVIQALDARVPSMSLTRQAAKK